MKEVRKPALCYPSRRKVKVDAAVVEEALRPGHRVCLRNCKKACMVEQSERGREEEEMSLKTLGT